MTHSIILTSVFLYGAMVLVTLSQVCLIVRIYTQEGVGTILANKTDNLVNNTEDLHQYIEVVKLELKQMYEEKISELQHKHENNISMLEHKLNVVSSEVSKLEQENSALKIRQLTQSGAGFTAVHFPRIYYADGEIIQFETEVYDGKNNYDHTTGIYTCPVDGMYLFSFEIFGYKHVGSAYCINKESTELSCSFSPTNQDGTASLVTHCSSGTQISVTASHHGATPWGQFNGISLSSFSGVLIAIDA